MGIGLPSAFSQELPHGSDIGDLYYSKFNYERASMEYEKLAAMKNPKPIIYRRLVDCYQHLRNYPKFLEWAQRATELSNAGVNDFYYYGEALQESGQYKEAIEAFKKAKGTKLVDSATLENYIQSCVWASDKNSSKEWFRVENLSAINTSFSEFGPSLYGDSLLLVSDRPLDENAGLFLKDGVTSKKITNKTGISYLKVFSVPLKTIIGSSGTSKDKMLNITAFNPLLSSGYHFGPVAFTHDGKRIYFTKTERARKNDSLRHLGVTKSDSARYFRTAEQEVNSKKTFNIKKLAFINRFELWYSDKVGSSWSEPKPFPYNGGVNFSVGHPAISNDGHYLYFASDMPGGKGGFDLYVSRVNPDGTFSKPENLENLNTSEDDEFPSIGEDEHLYFASNGRLGFGGLDIYQATGSANHWDNITNLGKPINSEKDDFSYLSSEIAGVKGFFSSNREGGEGADDIYISRRISNLQIIARENHSLRKIPFVSLSVSIDDGTEKKMETNTEGFLAMTLESGQKVSIKASRSGFRDSNMVFLANPQQLKNDTLTLFMDSIALKKEEVLADKDHSKTSPKEVYAIYYDLNKFVLREDALQILKGMVEDLKGKTKYKILVSSFCDIRGSATYNYWLSKKRSESALEKLVALGIPKEKVQISWFGNQVTISDCKNNKDCIEAEHIRNRRSDIKVVSL